MRRFMVVSAVCCAVIAGFAAASPALAAPAAPRTEAEASQQVNSWLEATGRWTGGYNNTLRDQSTLLDALNAGTDKALDYNETGQSEEGRAWGEAWAAERHADLARLRASLAALPRTPPGPTGPGWNLGGDAKIAAMTVQLARIPQLTEDQAETTEALALKYIASAVSAAGGDELAAAELGVAFFDFYIAAMEAENHMIEGYMPLMRLGSSPQTQVMTSTMSLNRTLIVAFALVRDDAIAAPVDRRAAAAAIRAEAASIDRDVAAIQPRIDQMRGTALTGELGRKVTATASSYDESRNLMAEMAGRVRSIADEVERNERLDRERLMEIVALVSPALERLTVLDEQREALLTQ